MSAPHRSPRFSSRKEGSHAARNPIHGRPTFHPEQAGFNEVESNPYGATVVIADTRDVICDLRDFEFNEARVRPPMLSTSLVRECARAKKRISIFLGEFHKGGTHTDWAMGILHDLVDAIYQVQDSEHIRFCAATNLLRSEFIAQLGGSLYRRMEDICTLVEVAG